MRAFLLGALLAVSLPAHAFLAAFADSYTIPAERPRSILVTLHVTNAAPQVCFSLLPGWQQALMVLSTVTLGPTFVPACAQWPLDGTHVCEVWIAPMNVDMVWSHEVAHCFDHEDLHGIFGV